MIDIPKKEEEVCPKCGKKLSRLYRMLRCMTFGCDYVKHVPKIKEKDEVGSMVTRDAPLTRILKMGGFFDQEDEGMDSKEKS